MISFFSRIGGLIFLACWVGQFHAQEVGLASYYHERLQGKTTASGEIHMKDELVAAHRTYPFGTFLRVTNLKNMKSVVVCVTDRGPRKRKRIIDVSEAAAKELDFIKEGITQVRIEEVPGPFDPRYLDFIYPKIPYLEIDRIKSESNFH